MERRLGRVLACLAVARIPGAPASGQTGALRPPVIDMHVHSTTVSLRALARLDSLNVRYVFIAGLAADLRVRAGAGTSRYLPALVVPCDRGRAPGAPRTRSGPRSRGCCGRASHTRWGATTRA